MTKVKTVTGSLAILLCNVAVAQTTGPASQPVGASGRSQEVLFNEIDAAHRRFNAAVTDPADISDPARRKIIAPKAIEPLRTMVDDFKELATIDPNWKRGAAQVQMRFMGYLSVLGDQPTIDQLQTMIISKDPAESLRGQASQLLAKWVLAGKDDAALSQLADQVQSLDQAHPESEDLTFLTVTLSKSSPSAPLEKRLMGIAAGMQNPVAANVRAEVSKTTTKP